LLTLAGCCGVGKAAAKLVSVTNFIPSKRVPTRYNLLEESLWAGICPAHSPPSSEYFCVEQFGKAPLGHGRGFHVKTWLQNVSEAALC